MPSATKNAPFYWTTALRGSFREELESASFSMRCTVLVCSMLAYLVILDYLMLNTDCGMDGLTIKCQKHPLRADIHIFASRPSRIPCCPPTNIHVVGGHSLIDGFTSPTSWQLTQLFALDPDFHPIFNVRFYSDIQEVTIFDNGWLRNNPLPPMDTRTTSFNR